MKANLSRKRAIGRFLLGTFAISVLFVPFWLIVNGVVINSDAPPNALSLPYILLNFPIPLWSHDRLGLPFILLLGIPMGWINGVCWGSMVMLTTRLVSPSRKTARNRKSGKYHVWSQSSCLAADADCCAGAFAARPRLLESYSTPTSFRSTE
jgi:hypothetical protein